MRPSRYSGWLLPLMLGVPALLWVLALIVGYLALHRALAWHLGRTHRASLALAVAAPVAMSWLKCRPAASSARRP